MKERVALSRYTTIGTGGPARWFAQPETIEELSSVLAWSGDHGHGVEVVGLGSNLLVHDDGVDAVVLKLAGELAAARVEDDMLVAGGGAAERRLPPPCPRGRPGRVRVRLGDSRARRAAASG